MYKDHLRQLLEVQNASPLSAHQAVVDQAREREKRLVEQAAQQSRSDAQRAANDAAAARLRVSRDTTYDNLYGEIHTKQLLRRKIAQTQEVREEMIDKHAKTLQSMDEHLALLVAEEARETVEEAQQSVPPEVMAINPSVQQLILHDGFEPSMLFSRSSYTPEGAGADDRHVVQAMTASPRNLLPHRATTPNAILTHLASSASELPPNHNLIPVAGFSAPRKPGEADTVTLVEMLNAMLQHGDSFVAKLDADADLYHDHAHIAWQKVAAPGLEKSTHLRKHMGACAAPERVVRSFTACFNNGDAVLDDLAGARVPRVPVTASMRASFIAAARAVANEM